MNLFLDSAIVLLFLLCRFLLSYGKAIRCLKTIFRVRSQVFVSNFFQLKIYWRCGATERKNFVLCNQFDLRSIAGRRRYRNFGPPKHNIPIIPGFLEIVGFVFFDPIFEFAKLCLQLNFLIEEILIGGFSLFGLELHYKNKWQSITVRELKSNQSLINPKVVGGI